MKHYLIILFLSISAIFIHGYQFAVSDQEIFIPYILRAQDHSLFPNDLLFEQSSAKVSAFYPLMGMITEYVNLELTFFLIYILFQYAFFLSLFRLSKVILKDENLSYLSLFPFFLPKFIGGTATLTFDTFFGYRSIGIIFLILYLSYLLENKFKHASLAALFGFIFHPLSIIPSLILLSTKTIKLISISILAVFISVIVIGTFNIKTSLLKEDLWLSIIKYRDDYLFLSTWSYRALAAIGLYLILTFLFLRNLTPMIKKSILLFTISGLSIFLSYYFLLEVFKIPYIAQFQLLRSISPLAYLGLSLSPFFLIYKNIVLKILGAICFVTLCLNQFYLFVFFIAIFIFALSLNKRKETTKVSKKYSTIIFLALFIISILINHKSYLNLSQKIQFPKETNDWINLQLWAKENTKKTDIFIVPPNQTGFRIFSERSIVADIKDGAVVMYSSTYAKDWFSRIDDTNSYQNFREDNFLKLKQIYDFNFIVVPNSQKLNFENLFENSEFIIYRI